MFTIEHLTEVLSMVSTEDKRVRIETGKATIDGYLSACNCDQGGWIYSIHFKADRHCQAQINFRRRDVNYILLSIEDNGTFVEIVLKPVFTHVGVTRRTRL